MISRGQPRMSEGGRSLGYRLRIGSFGGRDGGRDVAGQDMGPRLQDGQPQVEPAGRRPVLTRAAVISAAAMARPSASGAAPRPCRRALRGAYRDRPGGRPRPVSAPHGPPAGHRAAGGRRPARRSPRR